MKHLSIMKLFLLSALLSLLGGCTDVLQSEQASASKADEDLRTEMRKYFESTSPALRQVRFGKHDHAESRSSLPAMVNLSPNWKASRIWNAYKETYMEVPLQGEGIYQSSVIRTKRSIHAFPTKSALIITRNHQTEEMRYYIVTVMVNPCGERNIPEENFHFVGNSDFNGILIFSRVDGSFLQALCVYNHHASLIGIGLSPIGTTRTMSDPASTPSEYCTLMLTSSTMGYTCGECNDGCMGSGLYTCDTCGCPVPEPSTTCGCCKDAETLTIYCAFCYASCDPYTGACPNGCEVEIAPEDHYVTCDVCGAYYDMNLFKNCPFGCDNVMTCPICHKYPCECHRVCERCGSMGCPGPWFCSTDDECSGEQCLVCGGYKSTTRSSSNCPVCTCKGESTDETETVEVKLKIENSKIDLFNSYGLTVLIPSRRIPKKVEFQIGWKDQIESNYWVLQNSTSLICNNTAIKPGYWSIRVVVQMNDMTTVTSEVKNIEVRYPKASTIQNNPAVIRKMENVWGLTKAALTPETRQELGFWIYANTQMVGEYIFGPIQYGEPIKNEIGTHGSLTPGRPELHRPSSSPLVGGVYRVAFFHSHTPLTNCGPDASREVGFSDADINWVSGHAPLFVYDYVGERDFADGTTFVKGGHGIDDPASISYLGTRCKTPQNINE